MLNIDDPLVRSIGEHHSGRIVWVGKSEGATLRLLELSSRWPEPLILRIQYEGEVFEVRTQLHGVHLALPVLMALGIAVAAGMSLREAIAALACVPATEGRMQIEVGDDGVTFVRDDWKVAQWSFQAPLEFMREARAKRKVVVVGSISDSAKSPSRRYPQAARAALEVAELVVFVGTDAFHVSSKVAPRAGRSLRAFVNIHEAARFLGPELRAGDLVLLKGTNVRDHLVRLLLDRRRPVLCWQTDCGRNYFCTRCSQLYNPHQPASDAQPVLPDVAGIAGRRPATAATRDSGSPLIVGLGNPGDQYRDTAHNVGQRVLDALARNSGGEWEEQPEGLVATIAIDGVAATLLKPGVNINDSGSAAQRFSASAPERSAWASASLSTTIWTSRSETLGRSALGAMPVTRGCARSSRRSGPMKSAGFESASDPWGIPAEPETWSSARFQQTRKRRWQADCCRPTLRCAR